MNIYNIPLFLACVFVVVLAVALAFFWICAQVGNIRYKSGFRDGSDACVGQFTRGFECGYEQCKRDMESKQQ